MRLVGSFRRVKELEGGARETGRELPAARASFEKKKENRKQNVAVLRFFYCIPIGTMAYMVWASHRSL